MGLLSNILNKIRGTNTFKLSGDAYSISDKHKISNIENIQTIDAVRHGDGSVYHIMMARVTQFDINNMQTNVKSEYITFEVPVNQRLNERMLPAIVKQYENEKESGDKTSYYLGKVMRKGFKFLLGKKSATVANSATQKVEEIKNARKEAKENDAKKRSEEAFEKFNKSIDARGYIKKVQEESKDRIKNPFIKERIFSINDDIYKHYDGVNPVNGNIMRVRDVYEVADESGVHIYIANLTEVPNEDMIENFSNRNLGNKICFTTEEKIEDIINSKDTEKINGILSMLSGANKSVDKMQFLGGIDNKGKISMNAKSSSIRDAIKFIVNSSEKEDEISQNVKE